MRLGDTTVCEEIRHKTTHPVPVTWNQVWHKQSSLEGRGRNSQQGKSEAGATQGTVLADSPTANPPGGWVSSCSQAPPSAMPWFILLLKSNFRKSSYNSLKHTKLIIILPLAGSTLTDRWNGKTEPQEVRADIPASTQRALTDKGKWWIHLSRHGLVGRERTGGGGWASHLIFSWHHGWYWIMVNKCLLNKLLPSSWYETHVIYIRVLGT